MKYKPLAWGKLWLKNGYSDSEKNEDCKPTVFCIVGRMTEAIWTEALQA